MMQSRIEEEYEDKLISLIIILRHINFQETREVIIQGFLKLEPNRAWKRLSLIDKIHIIQAAIPITSQPKYKPLLSRIKKLRAEIEASSEYWSWKRFFNAFLEICAERRYDEEFVFPQITSHKTMYDWYCHITGLVANEQLTVEALKKEIQRHYEIPIEIRRLDFSTPNIFLQLSNECKRLDHTNKKKNTFLNEKEKNNFKPNIICNFCKKKGHIERACYKKKEI